MNNQIISQIRNLLSPAALAYLNDLVAGRQPLETRPGISATPEGLSAAQARVVRSIAQAEDNTDLNASSIINSGILRTRGGLASDNIPQSEQELYDRLYSITTGESLGTAGPQPVAVGTGEVGGGSSSFAEAPPDRNRLVYNYPSDVPPVPGEPAVGRLPGGGEAARSSIYNADLSELAKVWRPEVINFLRTGETEGLYVDEIRILNNWKRNPSAFRPDQLVQFGKLGEIDSASVNAFLEEWYRGYGQREVPEETVSEPPTPVSTVIAGGAPGQVPAGSVPIDIGLEPGETSRPARFPTAEPQPSTADMTGLGAAFGAAGIAAGEAAAAVSRPTAGVVSDVADTEADSNIPEDWRETAREMYPNYYAIVRNIPEIAALLERAVAETYTPEQFQAQLEQTNWFLQTSGSAREWEINSNRDPASAQRLIDEKRVSIRDTALATFGVRLSEERLTQLATDSLRFGWSDRFLQNAIGDVATTSTAGITQLREGYIGQQLRETANNYGIAVSDATFNQWVNKVAVGQESTASWEDYAKVQAKNLFPSIADRIDAGENFQQIVDPYRQSAAALLEIDGGDIDFTQPDWIKAITQMDDKGNQRQMSFTEWNDYVRQNRSFGYEYTEQAQRRAYQVANRLADLFGKV